jgi:hypothetical protein
VKAPGVDGIVTKVLVECADVLCKPLWIIYKLSLQTGKVPVDWKSADVTAILKRVARRYLVIIDQSVLRHMFVKY